MSYAWQIAGDALADLRQLGAELQELVLDELERLAESPERLYPDPAGYAVVDFDHVAPEAWHILFIRLHRDDARRLLTVLSIGAHSRPRPDTDGPAPA